MPSTQISRPADQTNALPHPPVTAPPCDQTEASTVATLVLADGSSFQGISFGAETKSIAGECVFQTGTLSRWLIHQEGTDQKKVFVIFVSLFRWLIQHIGHDDDNSFI